MPGELANCRYSAQGGRAAQKILRYVRHRTDAIARFAYWFK